MLYVAGFAHNHEVSLGSCSPPFFFAYWQPYTVPREMTVEEIKTCVDQFRQGALNCIEAGFDGIEVGADASFFQAKPPAV